jgi:hypothetical protein
MSNEVYVTLTVTGLDLVSYPQPETGAEIARFRVTAFADFPGWSVDYEEDSDGSLVLNFYTPWVAPSEWLQKLVAAFPQWTFEGSACCDQDEWYVQFQGGSGGLVETDLDYHEQFGEDPDEEEDAAGAAGLT